MVTIRNNQDHPITVTGYQEVEGRVMPAYHTFPPGDSSLPAEGMEVFAADLHFRCGQLLCLDPPGSKGANARSVEEIQAALKRQQRDQLRGQISDELKTAEGKLSEAEGRAQAAQGQASEADKRAAAAEAELAKVKAELEAAKAQPKASAKSAKGGK